MTIQNQDTPHAVVAQRKTGFNGLPEPEDLFDAGRFDTTDRRQWTRTTSDLTSVASWVALAAVCVSSAFLLRRALEQSRRQASTCERQVWGTWRGASDTDVTPPHGDKLLTGRA